MDRISTAHMLRDCALWFIAVLWLCGFVADHMRAKKINRKLTAPSKDCERVGQFEIHMGKR